NTWRAALQIGSEYGASVALISLCGTAFGLVVSGQYGISIRLLIVLQQLSIVWTYVKWPIAGQLRAQRRLADLRRLLWGRAWMQNLTFASGAVVLVLIAEPLLEWIGRDK